MMGGAVQTAFRTIFFHASRSASSILIAILTLVTFGTNSAWSQSDSGSEEAEVAAPAKPNSSADASVERIEVTGSRIKRIDVEGPSPVLTIGQDILQRSAFNSVSDVLREMSVASFGSTQEASGSGQAGVSTIGLRGLGPQRTLVLLNGKRLPRDPALQAVDLNLIPMAAVDRIEILQDGASALYGSDALGGVINIITKKNFDHMEVSMQTLMTEEKGGENFETSLIGGTASAKSNLLFVFTHRVNQQIFGRDRDFSRSAATTNGGSPGARRPDGDTEWEVDPNCPPELQVPDREGGTACLYRFNEFATTLPRLEQQSLLTNYNYKVNSNLNLFSRNIVSRKITNWVFAPVPGQFTTENRPGGDFDFRYRFTEAGNRDNSNEELSFNNLVGAEGYIGSSTWSYEASLGHSRVKRTDIGTNGYLVRSRVQELLNSGTFNPFNPPGSRGDINSARVSPFQIATSDLFQAEVLFSGELFDLKSGPLSMAIGGAFFEEKFREELDFFSQRNEVFGGSGASNGGRRENSAIFTEFAIPVTESLEVQVAGRYDDFSDVGSAFNPKLAARWQMANWLLGRTSVGTGFLAPTLRDLYGTSDFGFQTFIDRQGCATAGGAACNAEQYLIQSSGNPNLKSERALTYGVGFVVQPSSEFNFSIDGWYTKIDDVRGLIPEDVTQAELNGINPADFGVTVERTAAGTFPSGSPAITSPLLNLSREELSGLDTQFNWLTSVRVSEMSLGFNNQFSTIFFYKREGFPGAGNRDILDEFGQPRWRNSFSAFLRGAKSDFAIVARSLPGQKAFNRTSGRRIVGYTEYDLVTNYLLPWDASVTAGIKNILGSDRPLDPIGGASASPLLNTDLYDIRGRSAFLAYRQQF